MAVKEETSIDSKIKKEAEKLSHSSDARKFINNMHYELGHKFTREFLRYCINQRKDLLKDIRPSFEDPGRQIQYKFIYTYTFSKKDGIYQ
ncbi:hypothetical protein KY345_06775 [Candidatus Woesearchaeota archaeon]|nr:hypothetical protein [Candidatus Woesearchaeota archaeon]